jgi:hypothetical protein
MTQQGFIITLLVGVVMNSAWGTWEEVFADALRFGFSAATGLAGAGLLCGWRE